MESNTITIGMRTYCLDHFTMICLYGRRATIQVRGEEQQQLSEVETEQLGEELRRLQAISFEMATN